MDPFHILDTNMDDNVAGHTRGCRGSHGCGRNGRGRCGCDSDWGYASTREDDCGCGRESGCERESSCGGDEDSCERDDSSCESHNHEVLGSVRVADSCCDAHNHRFATVTSDAIRAGQSHVHNVRFTTDTYGGHTHEYSGRTSIAYPVGCGHVHFLEAVTSEEDGHRHTFQVITHMEESTDD